MPAKLAYVIVENKLQHVSNWSGMPSERRPSGEHSSVTAYCPECEEKVFLVYPKLDIANYARHQKRQEGQPEPDCHATGETAVHFNAKAEVAYQLGLQASPTSTLSARVPCRELLPDSPVACLEPVTLVLVTGWSESNVELMPTRDPNTPDVIVTMLDGTRVAIEVEHRSAISERKQEHLSANFDFWLTLPAAGITTAMERQESGVTLNTDTLRPEHVCPLCAGLAAQRTACREAGRSWAFDLLGKSEPANTRVVFEGRFEPAPSRSTIAWELLEVGSLEQSSRVARGESLDVERAVQAAEAALRRRQRAIPETAHAVEALGWRQGTDWSGVPATFKTPARPTTGTQLSFL